MLLLAKIILHIVRDVPRQSGQSDVVRNISRDIRGQSTIEFALITAGFLSLIVAISALWQAFGEGLFVEHALATASHHINGISLGVIGDVFLY